jgi:molybdopterin-guanine dinucleotide biosynthesis protein A
MPPPASGIVLAGGRSTRFGSDKLEATYRGRPLLHAVIDVVAGVCDDVIVVRAPGRTAEGLPDGVRVANDPREGEGPLAGLHAGLLAAVPIGAVLVVGGDMPELQPGVLRELLAVLDRAEADAAVLVDGDRRRPLPAALRTRPAATVAHSLLHEGRRRLRDLFDGLRTAVIDEETWTALDPRRRTLLDVDEPGDLPG